MEYLQEVLNGLKTKNSNEPEFLQAAYEVLTTLKPVIEKHPEFKINALLERITEPERLISFRTTGSVFFCVVLILPEEDFLEETVSSTKVFHALHAGHCPIHLADSYPHS